MENGKCRIENVAYWKDISINFAQTCDRLGGDLFQVSLSGGLEQVYGKIFYKEYDGLSRKRVYIFRTVRR